jgi:hypothetical protein
MAKFFVKFAQFAAKEDSCGYLTKLPLVMAGLCHPEPFGFAQDKLREESPVGLSLIRLKPTGILHSLRSFRMT